MALPRALLDFLDLLQRCRRDPRLADAVLAWLEDAGNLERLAGDAPGRWLAAGVRARLRAVRDGRLTRAAALREIDAVLLPEYLARRDPPRRP